MVRAKASLSTSYRMYILIVCHTFNRLSREVVVGRQHLHFVVNYMQENEVVVDVLQKSLKYY